jgi:hypothetical protein
MLAREPARLCVSSWAPLFQSRARKRASMTITPSSVAVRSMSKRNVSTAPAASSALPDKKRSGLRHAKPALASSAPSEKTSVAASSSAAAP